MKDVFASELANINIQIDQRFADLDARVRTRSRSPLVMLIVPLTVEIMWIWHLEKVCR